MTEKRKEIWLPTTEMLVTVAGGEIALTENMKFELKPVPPKTGFQPKDKL